jgi:hypothetical protein
MQPLTGQALRKTGMTPPPDVQASELDALRKEKLSEEITKLKLENQALSRPPTSQPSTPIPIIAACIAAVVALIVPQITAAKQAAADRRKERRLALAQYGGYYASAVHHIQWLTWKTAHRVPLNTADLDAYDNAMDLLFPQLIGSFLTASALNPDLFSEAKELYDRIVKIDEQIGQHIAEIRKTGNEDAVILTSIHTDVNAFWNEVPARFKQFMESSS